MKILAFDFETANSSRSSVCAFGLAAIEDGKIVERRSWLVKPRPFAFEWYTTKTHGIKKEHVEDKPEFDVIWHEAEGILRDAVLIAHNASFDMDVLRKVLASFSIPSPQNQFYCTLQMARLVWPELPKHDLGAVAKHLGIVFRPHDAEEDAVACAQVYLKVCEAAGAFGPDELARAIGVAPRVISADDFELGSSTQTKNRVRRRGRGLRIEIVIGGRRRDEIDSHHRLAETGGSPVNGDQPLAGKTVVVTGTLAKFSRSEIEKLIKDLGGKAASSVSKKTDFLVCGEDAGSKLDKAKELGVKIVSEGEFLKMVNRT